jgi:hypothetical protein
MLNGAEVLHYALVGAKSRWTKRCRHRVGAEEMGSARALAICRYPGDEGYYLFRCDSDWKTLADTWHLSLEEAQQQAEFEYEGIGENWQP